MSLESRGISDPNPPAGNGRAVVQRDDLRLPFPIRVLTADSQSLTLVVEHAITGEVFVGVTKFPVVSSGVRSTNMELPERGWCGLAIFDSWRPAAHTVAVITWIPSDIVSGLDAIAHRPSTDPTLEGFGTRTRGVHRKPYSGQASATSSQGVHTFSGPSREALTRDLSEDVTDPDRRERVQTTGRTVDYTEAGLRVRGPVNRPGADPGEVPPEYLPDGTVRQVVFLQESKEHAARYLAGTPDLLPLVESLERVQEFGLDFPVPREVLESALLDEVLGVDAAPWARTEVTTQNGVQRDDQSYLVDQASDHPHDHGGSALGPAPKDGATPRRRGWIAERVTGTLVGYHRADVANYGKVLKPVLFPYTRQGRFATDLETGFRPVRASQDHVETRLAAVASMTRFPFDYNTTRVAVTKEGQVLFEIGATIPKENIGLDGSTYEHPHGAGRSIEGHVVGSTKLFLGKNRDEEDSLDVRTSGQVLLRIGADDGSLPDAGRSVQTQSRARGDAPDKRTLQYWKNPKLRPGDAGSLDEKVGAENVSLRAATDGGVFLRLGARNPKARRRHLMNGYVDGPGREAYAPGTGTRAVSNGRTDYGPGDANYRFNDLLKAGANRSKEKLYMPAGDCIVDLDAHGLSGDIHAVRDIFLRIGKNKLSDYSLLLDLEGGIVGIVGKDKKGRSLTSTFLGGVEISIGAAANGQAMALEVVGDVNWAIQGNWHVHCTGDIVFDAMKGIYTLAKDNISMKGTNIHQSALVKLVTEAPDLPHNQGFTSAPSQTLMTAYRR